MIFGYIKGSGERSQGCDESMNSDFYQEIIVDHLFPIYQRGEIMQQHGATPQASKSTEYVYEEEDHKVLSKWPARSPDLNIIKNL